MIPYKRDFVTLNKSVINYLPKCSYHLLYKWNYNLGPKSPSLLEFETWQLRPLGHNGRFLFWLLWVILSCNMGAGKTSYLPQSWCKT